MKTTTLLSVGWAAGLFSILGGSACAQDIGSMPPAVVKTVPEAGVKDVAPGVVTICVTFSKEMADHSWSWTTAWEGSCPETIGKGAAKYEDDRRTCTLKVKLEPNRTYGYWLNSDNYHNFKDKQGHPAVPYLLVFQTGAAGGIPPATWLSHVGDKSDDKRSLADSGHAVVFDRPEKRGRSWRSQIYASRYGLPKPPDEDFHVWPARQGPQGAQGVSLPLREDCARPDEMVYAGAADDRGAGAFSTWPCTSMRSRPREFTWGWTRMSRSRTHTSECRRKDSSRSTSGSIGWSGCI